MLGLSLLQFLGLGSVMAVGLIWHRRSKKKSLDSFLLPDAPANTVILHQFGAAPDVPSVSPFVIKLETFLRVAGIPYVNIFDRRFGPKGKLPWIQYNQQVVGDSQFCIEFLNEKFSVNLNRRLSPEQTAIGHAVRRMVEEFLYWATVSFRLSFDPRSTLYRQLGLPGVFIWYLRRETAKRAAAHGIGRHSQAEVVKQTEDDLRTISVLLGNKKFLFGNSREEVTEIDCAVFGQLCELLWGTPNCELATEANDKFPNLVQYCRNMKEAFWPDWEDRLLGAKENSSPKENGGNGSDAKSAPSLKRSGSSTDDITPVGPMSSDFTDSEVLRSRAAKTNGRSSS